MAENGLFPWKIQQLLSAVSNAAQGDFGEQISKPPIGSGKAPQVPKPKSPSDAEPELVSEIKPARVVEVPKGVIQQKFLSQDTDWELLSERASSCSVGGGGVVVARAGSVRSITSIDPENSSHTALSVPFKIQRTLSSSTIDSQDNILGPSGKGVLGVDYVEHIVLPTDTLQGVCLAYKVSSSSLRRANHFTGHSLHFAPKKLLIPLSKQALRTGFIRVQDTDTKEYKLHYFQVECPSINLTEAKAYLELADWELKDALQSAREDREWEREEVSKDDLKSGQIDIKVNFRGGKPLFNLKGIGRSASKSSDKASGKKESAKTQQKAVKQKVVVHTTPPAIATKSVFAEDLYNAAPEHSGFGLELKPLQKRDQSS